VSFISCYFNTKRDGDGYSVPSNHIALLLYDILITTIKVLNARKTFILFALVLALAIDFNIFLRFLLITQFLGER
jgi:hypothetical protein